MFQSVRTPVKSSKGKSRKKATNADSAGVKKGGEKASGRSDSALCESALKALAAVFESAGSFLKQEHHKVGPSPKFLSDVLCVELWACSSTKHA